MHHPAAGRPAAPRSVASRRTTSPRDALGRFAAAVATAIGLAGLAVPVVAQQMPRERPAQPQRPASPSAGDLTRYNASVVRVDAKVPSDATSAQSLGPDRVGTGIILDDRTVLTIGYVTLEADAVMVTTASGKRIPATAAGYDHATGFGLVRTVLPLDGKPMPLGDSDRIRDKQRVLTLGHGEPEATEIFVLSRKPFAAGWEYLLESPIFTFPPVNNWSGAALIADDGSLVGVGSLIVNDAAAGQPGVPGNLWVPVNLLKPIMEDLLSKGRRAVGANPWLGMTTETVRGNLMVVRVTRNGPAEAAGVAPGDIVVGVAGEKVADQAEFYRKVWKVGPAGATIPLKLLKDGDVRDLAIKSIDRADHLKKAGGI
ncbi:MAG TPA: S1C family serine protease [Burkholderiaceae bacterium]|nr:S1C family serine protease [Burkholderiaceae bacterium]